MKNLSQLALALLFSVLSLFQVQAQDATISGIITDSETNEPLTGAIVKTSASIVVSDYNGFYELSVPAGSYTIEVSYTGYDKQNIEVSVDGSQTLTQDVAMVEASSLLQEATVTSTKYSKPLGEVTVSMDIVKPTLIENANLTAVDDVIEKVPGVNVIDGQANIRGGSGFSYGAGSRVLLLVDDLPFLQGDAGFTNWRDISIENIEQVEVLKGAASALYGSSALNGIINILTAYPRAEPVTKAAAFTTMAFNPRDSSTVWWGNRQPFTTGAQFAHRQRFGRFDLVLGGNVYLEDSWRAEEYNRKGRININTRYRITDHLSAGVNINFNGGPSQSYFFWADANAGRLLSFPGTATPSKVTRYNIDPFVNIFDKYGNTHKILGRYYNVSNDNGNDQSNFSKVYYLEYQYTRTFEQLAGLALSAGIVGTYTTVEAELYGNASYTVSNGAAYLQLDKKFFDKLNLSAGFRFERNTMNSPDSIITFPNTPRELNPAPQSQEAKPVFRFGANYQPFDYTFFRASFGQGYRFPTVAERFASTAIGGLLAVVPNPELESETGWSAEVGVKQGFSLFGGWQGFFDASAFWTQYDNMMEFTFGGGDPANQFFGFQSINIGDVEIKGFEVSMVGQGKMGALTTNIITGYTYIDPRFQDFNGRQDSLSSADYNVLKYRFKHTFKLDVETTYRKVSVGVSVRYNSFMEAIDEAFLNIPLFPGIPNSPSIELIPGLRDYREENNNGDVVVDFRTAYRIDDKAKLSLLIGNVFNREYMYRPALLESPINATVRLDYNF